MSYLTAAVPHSCRFHQRKHQTSTVFTNAKFFSGNLRPHVGSTSANQKLNQHIAVHLVAWNILNLILKKPDHIRWQASDLTVACFCNTSPETTFGLQHTHHDLPGTFWVSSARSAIRRVIMHCYDCRRQRANGTQSQMSAHPSFSCRQPFFVPRYTVRRYRRLPLN